MILGNYLCWQPLEDPELLPESALKGFQTTLPVDVRLLGELHLQALGQEVDMMVVGRGGPRVVQCWLGTRPQTPAICNVHRGGTSVAGVAEADKTLLVCGGKHTSML